MNALATFDIVLNAHQVWEDGEPRWRDIDLAAWLDLSRDRDIRRLIRDNAAELEQYGSLRVVRANSGSLGGRPADVNLLNFDQCAIVCLLSRSRYGQELRYILLKVLKYLMGGGLATTPRMALRALDVAADAVIRPLTARFDRIECKVEYLDQTIQDLQRVPFSKKSLDTFYIIVVKYYFNLCPCCLDTPIVIDGRLVCAEADHWYGKRKRRVDQGWYVCRPCNRQLDDRTFRDMKYEKFVEFQAHVKDVLRQLDLPF